MAARVIVLAGPSGSGKSVLAARTGLPVLRLDDFYREAGDPRLPLIAEGPNAGTVDWDHRESWCAETALAALSDVCHTGRCEAPIYDIATSSRTGVHQVELGGAAYVVVEGLFAQDLVPLLAEQGLLAAAYCLDQPPLVTFRRRLFRDLRERRKPPTVLVTRGIALLREQRAFVRRAVQQGCVRVTPQEASRLIRELDSRDAPPPGQPAERPGAERVLREVGPQPDRRSCGAACIVVAHMLADRSWADEVLTSGPAAEVLATHRRVTQPLDASARAQIPWWRALGTPPWAIARELETHGPTRRSRLTLLGRDRLADRVRGSLDAGHTVPWYVGSRWLPRHVVLIVGHRDHCWLVFEPSRGQVVEMPEADFVAGHVLVGGWRRSWALVLPHVR